MYEREFKMVMPVSEEKVFVPKKNNIDGIITGMSRRFGGVSVVPIIKGVWFDSGKKKFIQDTSLMFISARDLDDPKIRNPKQLLENDRKFVHRTAKKFGKGQTSVFTEEDIIQDIDFVDPKESMHEGKNVERERVKLRRLML